MLVLQELLSRYFVKHLEVHRSADAFDFVTQQTDQVRARLNQTEDALKSLREKTGIASLKEGSRSLPPRPQKLRSNLTPLRRTWPNNKLLLVKKPRTTQRHGVRRNL